MYGKADNDLSLKIDCSFGEFCSRDWEKLVRSCGEDLSLANDGVIERSLLCGDFSEFLSEFVLSL